MLNKNNSKIKKKNICINKYSVNQIENLIYFFFYNFHLFIFILINFTIPSLFFKIGIKYQFIR